MWRTTSIEASENLARLLTTEKIPHQVLNAKQHEREALIVAQAGRPQAVTIATNMAGRGTDIVLGGNLEMELKDVDDDVGKQSLRAEWQQRHNLVVAAGGCRGGTSAMNRVESTTSCAAVRVARAIGMSRLYLSFEASCCAYR